MQRRRSTVRDKIKCSPNRGEYITLGIDVLHAMTALALEDEVDGKATG